MCSQTCNRGAAVGGAGYSFVSYDQLSDRIGPLASEDPDQLGIVLIESSGTARR